MACRGSGVRVPSAPPSVLIRGHPGVLNQGVQGGLPTFTQHFTVAQGPGRLESGPVWTRSDAPGTPAGHRHPKPGRPGHLQRAVPGGARRPPGRERGAAAFLGQSRGRLHEDDVTLFHPVSSSKAGLTYTSGRSGSVALAIKMAACVAATAAGSRSAGSRASGTGHLSSVVCRPRQDGTVAACDAQVTQAPGGRRGVGLGMGAHAQVMCGDTSSSPCSRNRQLRSGDRCA